MERKQKTANGEAMLQKRKESSLLSTSTISNVVTKTQSA